MSLSVFGLLASVGGFVKVRHLHDKADIDDAAFRLHYKFTSAFFFAACVLITAFELFGRPIECVTNDVFPRMDALNTYCWTQGTFTLAGESSNKRPGFDDFVYPGVGPEHKCPNKVYHSYYQWVPFVLFLQGILFYIPHWIWKQAEGGKIHAMTDGSRTIRLGDDPARRTRCVDLAKYLTRAVHHYDHLMYTYTLCELLNFANVVGNIYFIDKFLGGVFLTYGTQVIQMSEQDQISRTDPMITIFPRMTKCTFHKYGPSGSIVQRDALCLLPLNIAHEKVFIFLWFWFIILAVLTGLALVYRLLTATSTNGRLFHMRRLASSRLTSADLVVPRLSSGHFFLLCLLAKNLQGLLFNTLMDELALQVDRLSQTPNNRRKTSDLPDWTVRPGSGAAVSIKNDYQPSTAIPAIKMHTAKFKLVD